MEVAMVINQVDMVAVGSPRENVDMVSMPTTQETQATAPSQINSIFSTKAVNGAYVSASITGTNINAARVNNTSIFAGDNTATTQANEQDTTQKNTFVQKLLELLEKLMKKDDVADAEKTATEADDIGNLIKQFTEMLEKLLGKDNPIVKMLTQLLPGKKETTDATETAEATDTTEETEK
jgi:hypothetical protein